MVVWGELSAVYPALHWTAVFSSQLAAYKLTSSQAPASLACANLPGNRIFETWLQSVQSTGEASGEGKGKEKIKRDRLVLGVGVERRGGLLVDETVGKVVVVWKADHCTGNTAEAGRQKPGQATGSCRMQAPGKHSGTRQGRKSCEMQGGRYRSTSWDRYLYSYLGTLPPFYWLRRRPFQTTKTETGNFY